MEKHVVRQSWWGKNKSVGDLGRATSKGLSITFYLCVTGSLWKSQTLHSASLENIKLSPQVPHLKYLQSFYTPSSLLLSNLHNLPKLLIQFLHEIKKPFEQLNPQPRILAPCCCPNTMHTQLRQSGINCPHPHLTTQHRSHCSPRPDIVSDLKDL